MPAAGRLAERFNPATTMVVASLFGAVGLLVVASGAVAGAEPGAGRASLLILNNVLKYRTLDGTFGALANPTRRQIVLRLWKGEASVSELAAPHNMSLPAISRHISVLEDAGLVFKRRKGRQQYCSLATSPLQEIDAWVRRFRDAPATSPNQRKEQHG